MPPKLCHFNIFASADTLLTLRLCVMEQPQLLATMHTEHDFSGMPSSERTGSERTSSDGQDAYDAEDEDHSDQDSASSSANYGSRYSRAKDVDLQMQYSDENFSPTGQSPDLAVQSRGAAGSFDDSGYNVSPPTCARAVFQNVGSADTYEHRHDTVSPERHHIEDRGSFHATSPPTQVAQAGNMQSIEQGQEPSSIEADCTLPEHRVLHQSLQETPTNHLLSQRPQQRQPETPVNTTAPKLLWKKPTPNMQIYRRSSGRGFSCGIVPSSVLSQAQPQSLASQYYANQRTQPSAGLRPKITAAVPQLKSTTAVLPPQPAAVSPYDQARPAGESQVAGGEDEGRNGVITCCTNEQAEPAQHDAENANLAAQLQRTTGINQELQNQADRLNRENETLRKSQTRKDGLGVKANNFRTFLKGLGTDILTMKQDISIRQQRTEELFQELDVTKATHHALLEQSAQLKAEALKVAREAHAELTEKTVYARHLKEQLDEKCRMLADEKNHRLQLQSQLLNKNSNEDVERQLKSYTDAVLDKLFLIHAEIEHNGVDETMEKKLVAATQGLVSQQVVTIADIASIKGTVDVVLKSLQSSTSTAEKSFNLESSMTSRLEEAFKALKTDVCRHEELVVKATVDRESIARLTQELHGSNEKIADQTSALEASRASYEDLKERYILLQGQADTVAQSIAKHDADMERMLTSKADAQTQAKALEAMSADLATKTGETKTLSDANSTLRAEVVSLQEALTSARAQERPAVDQEDFAEKLSAAVKAAKEEVSRNANDLHIQDKIKSANNLKKIVSARNELIEKNAHLQAELASAQDEAKVFAGQQQNFADLQKLADDRELEVQSLQTRVNDLTQSVALSRDAEEKYAKMNIQHTAQAKQLEEIVQHRYQLAQELECVQNQLEDCKKEVQAAEKRAQDCEFNAQYQLNNEQEKSRKQVDALQQYLKTLQAEMHVQVEESKKTQHIMQNSWEDNEKQQREQCMRLTDQAAEAEAEKNHAVAERLRLESELAKATASLMRRSGPHLRSPNHQAHDLADEVSPMSRAHGNLQQRPALNLSQAQSEALAVVKETPPRPDRVGNAMLHSDASQQGLHDASVGVSHHMASQSFLGSSQGYVVGAEETQDFIDRLTKPDTKASTRSPFVHKAQPEFAVHQDDPIGANDRIQTGSSQGALSTLGDGPEFRKRMAPPNSSMKRAQPRSVSQSGQNTESRQQSSRYTTPEPRAAKSMVADSSRMSGKSSSPDFMINSAQGTTSYHGMGKLNAGVDVRGGGATPQGKRKATTQVVHGYESQRKKLVAREPGRGRSGLRSLAQPPVRTLEESGLQSELEASQSSQSHLRVPAGPHGRPKGGGKNLTKNERMAARFAKELSR